MLSRVSPFRYLRISAHVQLPAAFRSLSRLSSALSAKASTLCSWLLNHFPFAPSVTLLGFRLPLPGTVLSSLELWKDFFSPLPRTFRNLFIPENFFHSGMSSILKNVFHSLASDVLYISFLQTLILKIFDSIFGFQGTKEPEDGSKKNVLHSPITTEIYQSLENKTILSSNHW